MDDRFTPAKEQHLQPSYVDIVFHLPQQRITLELEQRLVLISDRWRFPGLVVNDANLAGGCDIDPIHITVQPQIVGQPAADVSLTMRGVEHVGPFDFEISSDEAGKIIKEFRNRLR